MRGTLGNGILSTLSEIQAIQNFSERREKGDALLQNLLTDHLPKMIQALEKMDYTLQAITAFPYQGTAEATLMKIQRMAETELAAVRELLNP